MMVITNKGTDDAWIGTLEQFFADNEDGIGASEQMDVRDVLAAGRVYHGGGGAAAAWTIEVAK